jgi:hypothetical protein
MKTIAKNSSNIISKLILGLIMVGCSFTTTAQAEVLEAPSDQAQIESASNETHIYPEEKELLQNSYDYGVESGLIDANFKEFVGDKNHCVNPQDLRNALPTTDKNGHVIAYQAQNGAMYDAKGCRQSGAKSGYTVFAYVLYDSTNWSGGYIGANASGPYSGTETWSQSADYQFRNMKSMVIGPNMSIRVRYRIPGNPVIYAVDYSTSWQGRYYPSLGNNGGGWEIYRIEINNAPTNSPDRRCGNLHKDANYRGDFLPFFNGMNYNMLLFSGWNDTVSSINYWNCTDDIVSGLEHMTMDRSNVHQMRFNHDHTVSGISWVGSFNDKLSALSTIGNPSGALNSRGPQYHEVQNDKLKRVFEEARKQARYGKRFACNLIKRVCTVDGDDPNALSNLTGDFGGAACGALAVEAQVATTEAEAEETIVSLATDTEALLPAEIAVTSTASTKIRYWFIAGCGAAVFALKSGVGATCETTLDTWCASTFTGPDY